MSIQLFNLSGRTVLITGSSRGLGLAIAEGCAAAGARIVLNGVDKDRLQLSAQSLRAKGYDVLEAPFDVADEAAIAEAFQHLDSQGIHIHILVNNAGIQLRKPMLELSGAEWKRVLDVNLTSAFLVGRETAARMISRREGGKIINIGSLTSEVARATVAPYTAAKGGIKLLTRSMAAEWAEHNIQANAIGPGYMATDMNQALMDNPTFDAWVKSRTPAKRWGQPEELIGAALFLASAASNYVNGQIIYVDGGMLAVL
jgi:gluconate 5-dehydrogenase